jgi:predicted phosphate transport protein (TIGR00153 family)
MLFWKKQRAVIDKIRDYLEQVHFCSDQFRRCSRMLIVDVASPEAEQPLRNVHSAESKADDLRREIEYELYQRALIPESRGDVLGILENFDHIPGMFQSLCHQIRLQTLQIPEEFRQQFGHLIDINLEAYELASQAVLALFYAEEVKEKAALIDAKESESDRIERLLIEGIFKSDLDKADKILLKEIVINIGDISDQAENVKDRLILAVVKRKI